MRTIRTVGLTALVAGVALALSGCVSGGYAEDYRGGGYYQGGSGYRSTVYPNYYLYPGYQGYSSYSGYYGYPGYYGSVPYRRPHTHPGRDHDGRDHRDHDPDRDRDRDHDRDRHPDRDQDRDRRDRGPNDGRDVQDRGRPGLDAGANRNWQVAPPARPPERRPTPKNAVPDVRPPERRPPPKNAAPNVRTPRPEPERRPGAAPRIDADAESGGRRLPD